MRRRSRFKVINRVLTSDEFIFKINVVASQLYELETASGETYNYNVDWGDGNVDTLQTGNASNTYAAGGIYTVRISGIYPRFNAISQTSQNRASLVEINNWGNPSWSTSQASAFRSASNLSVLPTDQAWIDYMSNTIISGDRMF